MKKATKMFMLNRPNSILRFVQKMYDPNSIPNHCYQNSLNISVKDKDYAVVSGWLIGDYFGEKGTAIMPHFWLEHKPSKIHYDPTPINVTGFKQTYEYVEDLELFDLGTKDNYLPAPVNLTANGEFRAVANDGRFIKLEKLDLKMLYEITKESS